MSTNDIRGQNLGVLLHRFPLRRGLAFGVIIVTALLAFEVFNYSTTVFALSDLLGNLKFAGIAWATILAIAFCGIDFAGIARLFTPEEGINEPTEVWYLFGAWLLAATMNAMLTWWGVSIAILNHQTLGNAVVERETLLRVVPIFVAVMVWLIRVLIIGTFSVAGERLFSQAEVRSGYASATRSIRPVNSRIVQTPVQPRAASPVMHTPKVISQPEQFAPRPEPTYHPVSMSARPNNANGNNTSNSQRSIPTIRR